MPDKKAKRKSRRGSWFSDGIPATNPDDPVDPRRPGPAAKAAMALQTAKDLKERRIAQIAALMRLMVTPKGDPVWTPKAGKALAKGWGITYADLRRLSAEASKQVIAGVKDNGGIERNTLVAWEIGLFKAIAEGRLGDIATFVGLGDKLNGAATRVEVTVQAKQPTPRDAVSAVKEMFGEKVSYSGTEVDVPQLTDGSEPPGGSSEE